MARHCLRIGLDVLKMAREGRVSCVPYRESDTGILEGDSLLLWASGRSAFGTPDADHLEVVVTGARDCPNALLPGWVRDCPNALLPGWVLVDFEVPKTSEEYEIADREA